ncbi:MAG: EamA family transporter, partial [Prochlorotrichaceae cyanobacterium]
MSFSQPPSEETLGQATLEQTVEQTEQLLNAINGALQQIQQDVITELNEDVLWLRSERESLLKDIAQLREQQQHLLSDTQLAQQQEWAQEFAKILTRYLQQNLQQQLQEDLRQMLLQFQVQQSQLQQSLAQSTLKPQGATGGSPTETVLSDRDWQRLQQTIDRTFQQYSQQMERFFERSLQGNPTPVSPPISPLTAVPTAAPPLPTPPQTEGWGTVPLTPPPSLPQSSPWATAPLEFPSPVTAPAAPPRPTVPAVQWHRQGISLAVLSILMLSLQYVLAQALFQFQGEGSLNPVQNLELQTSWTHTALLVGLRMLVFLPLIIVFNRWLQPNLGAVFQEALQRSLHHRQLWWNLGLSGLFLFLSQWFLFRVVGLTSAGVAVGLFFAYPGLVPLLHWGFTGDRPSQFRFQCILALGVGATLIFSQPSLSQVGVEGSAGGQPLLWGLGSAVLFAFYLLMSDRCNQRLNPSVVSLVQYGFVIFFSLLALFNFDQISALQLTNIGLGGLVLGGTAALSYILHVFAVQMMGAIPAMILNNFTPLLTAILGFILLQSPLAIAHGLGIVIITIGGV